MLLKIKTFGWMENLVKGGTSRNWLCSHQIELVFWFVYTWWKPFEFECKFGMKIIFLLETRVSSALMIPELFERSIATELKS